jgi:2-phosphoglycolate phosphatase
MQIKAVIFDLDGTIVDTGEDIVYALNILLSKHNRPLTSLKDLAPIIPQGTIFMIKHTFGDTNNINELMRELQVIREANLIRHASVYPGMSDTINKLHEDNYKLAIVSNNYNQRIAKILTHMKLNQYFPVIVGQDDLGILKPNPAPILHACNKLNVAPEECIYVGDSIVDQQTAINSNMPFILAAYGDGKNTNITTEFVANYSYDIHKIVTYM